MVGKDHDKLENWLEELVDRKDELQTGGQSDIHQRYFLAWTLANDLGYTKVATQMRNRNLENALALLNDEEIAV